MKEKLVYADLSYRLNGICFQVHNELGRYRNELQYADALEGALKQSGLSYEREKFLATSFKGEQTNRNKPDFVIEDKKFGRPICRFE